MINKKFVCTAVPVFIILHVMQGYALEVRLEGDRLSVQAENTPLRTVLERIAECGIRISIDPVINPEITASFENRDLQTGLESILRTLNYVLVWEDIKGPPGPVSRLAEIQVYRPGRREFARPLAKNRGLRIGRNPEDGSLFVRDEILLRVGPEMDLLQLQKLLREIRGTIVDGHPELGIYRIRLPEDSDLADILALISGRRGIRRADPDYAYQATPPIRLELSSAPAGTPPLNGGQDGAASIAVLDTGYLPDAGLGETVKASLDVFNPDQQVTDPLGHGTQMALVASGRVRPMGTDQNSGSLMPVIPIDVFDENGYTSDFHILKSIDFAIENGARVMSLSWGSGTRSKFLEDAMNYAASKGLIIVASAGNEPTGKPIYPAAYGAVLAVGALDPDGKKWKKSNFGNFVSVYAPGFAHMPVGYQGDPGLYAGTSISAAYTAHKIAEIISRRPDADVEEVLEKLVDE